MAKPLSEEKRDAVLDAAARTIARLGLGASTALIAKEAGVATGSLFTYFPTKADLLNQLYLALKFEMAAAALVDMQPDGDARGELARIWNGWLHWATSAHEKRRALAQLSVSDEISRHSRAMAGEVMAPVARLLDTIRVGGPMRNAPLGLVASLLNALAEATVDHIIADPEHADAHRAAGFEAVWRVIA